MTEKEKDNENVIQKAGEFFSKKLDERYVIDEDFNNAKFRDLDDESLKISKIKARIDFLRNKKSSTSSEKNQDDDDTSLSDSKELKVKKDSNTKKFHINISKKNFDSNSMPIQNFIFSSNDNEKVRVMILGDVEINSKLNKIGKIIEIPKFLLIEMITRRLGRLLNKYEIKKFKDYNTFKVKETFGLSETKKSKLNNTKKLSDS